MSAKKSNKTLPMILVALLAVAGAGYYFTQVKTSTPEAGTSTEMAAAEGTEAPTADNTPENVEAAAGTEEPPKPGEIVIKQGNPVVARVGGKDINRQDVYRFIQTMPANMQQLPATTVYPMALEQVINTQLVQNKADSANVMEDEQFKTEMEIAKQQIARNLFLQTEVDKQITDAKVKKAYGQLIEKSPDVEERRARHILVKTEDKAKAVIDQLNAGGDFAEVAKELSEGPTAPKGGDLGYFAKTEMVPEFASAAFGMEKGAVLEAPVKTQFGWHVIKVEDVRQRAKPTLEQLTPSIKAELRRSILEDLLKKWRKSAKIEQFDINGEPLKKGADVIGIIPPADAGTAKN